MQIVLTRYAYNWQAAVWEVLSRDEPRPADRYNSRDQMLKSKRFVAFGDNGVISAKPDYLGFCKITRERVFVNDVWEWIE